MAKFLEFGFYVRCSRKPNGSKQGRNVIRFLLKNPKPKPVIQTLDWNGQEWKKKRKPPRTGTFHTSTDKKGFQGKQVTWTAI